ncbi:hypothetical protein KPH14_006455 [Odynerus spinipes]|uniref:PPIase cyclophilin-type domain-containing protein n=1 Tax=Odynerus spinipes TaxID=1348599 RepID=A0AAD9RQD5_9HYME|nr:hypothetical protein KPH14_006455 [Odynerus spinipes]
MLTKKLLQCHNPHLIICGTFGNNTERLTGKNYQINYTNNDNLIKIRVEGLITAIAFHKARLYAQKLFRHLSYKYATPQIREMLQVDWYEYLQKMKVRVGGKMWILKRHVAVFINDAFIGSDIEFLEYINESYVFHMQENIEYYDKLVKEYYKEFIQKTKRIYVYFTFCLDGSTLGSLLFMLYSDLLPHTCKHFLNLCTGKYESLEGFATSHYLNTSVHRIVKNGWIQLGDIKIDTVTSDMITIPTIPDESYCIPHNRRGVLSMANNGKHSNESQIIVSLKPNSWMDYHYVAFGLDEEPETEAETDVFLERKPWIDVDGEKVEKVYQYPFDTYSDISMWLDNIIDEIDIRDTASLLIAERYLSGLYCLSTDYISDVSIHHTEEDQVSEEKRNITCDSNLCELLHTFQPDTMNKEEKTDFIKKLRKIIVSYALDSSNNESCAQCISEDTYGTVHKILEYAYDIARAIIARSLKKDLSIADTKAEINNLLKTEKHDGKTHVETSLFLVEEILNKSIFYCLQSTTIVECEQIQ